MIEKYDVPQRWDAIWKVLRGLFYDTVLTLRDRGLLIQYKKSCYPTTIDLQGRPIDFKTLLGPEPWTAESLHVGIRTSVLLSV